MVGTQFAVAKLVTRLGHGRARLLQRGGGGFQVGLGNVQLRLGAHAAVVQLLLAAGIGLGVDPLRLDLGQVAFGGAQLVTLISRIKAGKQVTRFHLTADIDPASGDATAHTKTQGTLVARLDAASETAQVGLDLRLGDHRQHRPDRFRRSRLLFTTAEQQQAAQAQGHGSHCATPLSLFAAISTCMPGFSSCPPATTTVSPPLRPSPTTTLPVR
ncbi:hypothetical protein D3C79_702360 [compost metagenome]